MLYTLSNAQYNLSELEEILGNITEQDAVVLWQNGVLQAVKNSQLFAKIANLYILEQDVQARGLAITRSNFQQINLTQLVELTEKYYPQLAL
ncbi:sulfur transfer complex subunit TusB [Phocoenobacter uteri]|uniref:Sulfur transfer complex subunit TusB n=1 Tax=Phocoenobacter uteri TaxID=146806 RepID=A0A379CBL3_9PAST|nr:sulfurtransferase complex subunit TusB [Phocoenobacter uteri]MDG6881488.1 hypothetical protein [Phocoenobacter uteri]SUB59518.1 sulfur transfer complex subunit TusB [Phocoenobacter uteri]